MVRLATHTRNLWSAINPSKCTHTAVNIHLEQWAANAVVPGEQLWVRFSRGIEGGESAGCLLPPPTIPAGPETRTHDLQVTSPTLYPLGHDYDGKKCLKSVLKQLVSKTSVLRLHVLILS